MLIGSGGVSTYSYIPPPPPPQPAIWTRDPSISTPEPSQHSSSSGGWGWFKKATHFGHTVTHDVAQGVRTVDTVKGKIGSAIDSGEQFVEHKTDGARRWLQQHGGIAGKVTSDVVGFNEGAIVSIYGAGKSVVQLSDNLGSLVNPLEWAANPQANIGRVHSAVDSVIALGKIGELANPVSWITNGGANAKLATSLWKSGAKSFRSDPSKFLGNATATVATMFVPGADGAEVTAGVTKATEVASDAGKGIDVTQAAASAGSDATRTVEVTNDTSKGVSAATDGAPAVETAPSVGAASPTTKSEPVVSLYGFRGAGRVTDLRAPDAPHPYTVTGHVGYSLDGGQTIYGFGPHAPGMEPYDVVQSLLKGEQYPGVLHDDTEVFREVANNPTPLKARDGQDQVVIEAKFRVSQDQFDAARARHETLGVDNPMDNVRYGFPRAQDGVTYNCATFPALLGLQVPEQTGNLRLYIPELERLGSVWRPQ